jgi:hypothetical protein
MLNSVPDEFYLKSDKFAVWPVNPKMIKEIRDRKDSAWGAGAITGNIIGEKRLTETVQNFENTFESLQPPVPNPQKTPPNTFGPPELRNIKKNSQ